LYPFSFAETLQIFNSNLNPSKPLSTEDVGLLKKAFREYGEIGGFPEYIETRLPDSLHMLYQNILYRDVVTRYRLSNPRPLKELIIYLASNIGKEISFNRLKTLLNLGSSTTVSDYCSYLENVYLCFLINRYDPSLSKQTLHPKKCYLIDHALAKTIGFRPSEDRGRLLENLVFLELKRRQKEIYFHKNQRECDFLIREGSEICEAIQVCLHCNSPETKTREISGLIEAMRTYKLSTGLILTEDDSAEWVETEGTADYTIKMQPVWKWLLEAESSR
jgi:predicted AAA+ superfamily ATPase